MNETNYLDISGMHCAACVARIEKVVSKMEGVSEVNVNLTTETGLVTFDNDRIVISEIINRINKIGFEARKSKPNNGDLENKKHKEIVLLQWKLLVSILLTIPLAWAMFAHFKWTSFIRVPHLVLNPYFQLAITFPIQFIIGFQFYERAWKSLKNRSANMDVLVVLSTSAAFFYSHYLTFNSNQVMGMFYETSAFIITFILLGKLLETKTKLRTTEAIKKLYQLQTKTATLYLHGIETKIHVEQISPGDIIIVKPGEKVPIDGQVIKGNSSIDESLLTGESIPVDKNSGDYVFAGTINKNGVLQVKVTKRDSETTLSQIIRIVEEAQAYKAPIQHIADKITAVFVPFVVLTALLTFIAWYFYFQPNNFHEALEKVIAVLIIACPCALGLATPTSVTVGSGRAAQMGILFKEGKFLDLLAKNNIIVLDKTGTITRGNPEVTDIYVENYSKNAFLELVGAVENTSGHPVAKAIMNKVNSKIKRLPNATQVVAIPGNGIQAFVSGKKVIIANPSYYLTYNIMIPSHVIDIVKHLEQEGKTVMVAFINSRFAGIIAVADEVKPSSVVAISKLNQLGLNVIMLTGDNANAANLIARQSGITNYQAGVSPQEKADIIKQLQHEGNKVIMVGDGINDAPALAVADVGIAIGSGSDVAIESGDITLINGDLNGVIDAITISKKTMRNIKQNFIWAFLYNIIMIPFAIIGLLAPWLAGAAMALSSVSVVLNSLRLKRTPL